MGQDIKFPQTAQSSPQRYKNNMQEYTSQQDGFFKDRLQNQQNSAKNSNKKNKFKFRGGSVDYALNTTTTSGTVRGTGTMGRLGGTNQSTTQNYESTINSKRETGKFDQINSIMNYTTLDNERQKQSNLNYKNYEEITFNDSRFNDSIQPRGTTASLNKKRLSLKKNQKPADFIPHRIIITEVVDNNDHQSMHSPYSINFRQIGQNNNSSGDQDPLKKLTNGLTTSKDDDTIFSNDEENLFMDLPEKEKVEGLKSKFGQARKQSQENNQYDQLTNKYGNYKNFRKVSQDFGQPALDKLSDFKNINEIKQKDTSIELDRTFNGDTFMTKLDKRKFMEEFKAKQRTFVIEKKNHQIQDLTSSFQSQRSNNTKHFTSINLKEMLPINILTDSKEVILDNQRLNHKDSSYMSNDLPNLKVKHSFGKSTAQINGQEITPELAAQIVKNYIVPMFSDKRHDKKQSMKIELGRSEKKTSREVPQQSDIVDTQSIRVRNSSKKIRKSLQISDQINNKNTVLSEIQLNQELYEKLKDTQEDLQDTMEELERLKLFYKSDSLKFENTERFEGRCQNLETQNKLMDIQFVYLKEEFQIVHNSISQLSKYKMLQDQHDVTVDMLKQDMWKANQDRRDAQQQIITYIDKNDQLMHDLKIMIENSKEVQIQKDDQIKQLRERCIKADIALQESQDSYQSLKNMNIVNESNLNKALEEVQVLKKRIERLKVRKIKVNQKICKFCNTEFIESENYNWSCRIHQSDYGGEMWWCCGRKSKEAPGCKFNKHINKDDEEQETQDQRESHHQEQVRCYCCKQLGHSGLDCDKDPNFKTLQGEELQNQVTVDENRLQKIETDVTNKKRLSYLEDFRKYIGILIKQQQEELENATMTNRKQTITAGSHIQKRLLEFDDYNYTQINRDLERGLLRKTTTMRFSQKLRTGINFDKMKSFKDKVDEYEDQTLDLNEDINAVIEFTDEGDIVPEVKFDMNQVREQQKREPFDDIGRLKFQVATKQENNMEQTLVDIMKYLPKRFTPNSSSQFKSSKAGSARGGLNKSTYDKYGNLMSSQRQGLLNKQGTFHDEFGLNGSFNQNRSNGATPLGILSNKIKGSGFNSRRSNDMGVDNYNYHEQNSYRNTPSPLELTKELSSIDNPGRKQSQSLFAPQNQQITQNSNQNQNQSYQNIEKLQQNSIISSSSQQLTMITTTQQANNKLPKNDIKVGNLDKVVVINPSQQQSQSINLKQNLTQQSRDKSATLKSESHRRNAIQMNSNSPQNNGRKLDTSLSDQSDSQQLRESPVGAIKIDLSSSNTKEKSTFQQKASKKSSRSKVQIKT
eukprot:403344555